MKEIFAEIITIGDEILYGQITDTNSQWISAKLDKIGIKTRRKTSISDKHQEIVDSLDEAFERVDIILITGGLGPTKDDITKKVLADYFDTELVLHKKALEDLTKHVKKLGFELTNFNKEQAFLPVSCTYIPNKLGTAPCMWFEKDGKVLVSMPGVPFEMKGIITNSILGLLKKQFDLPVIFHKTIRTVDIGESSLAEKIFDWEDNLPEHIKLAYLPDMQQVKLRLTAVGNDARILEKEIEQEFKKIKPLIASYIFGYDETELQEAVGQLLKSKGKTIATAESCTGGYLAHLFTSIPGSSAYYNGTVVTYQNEIKTNVLDVKENTIIEYGAVSKETAKEMAEGVRKKFCADIGFAITGIAGPTGGSKEKPVGLVWMAFADADKILAWKVQLINRTRELNIKYSTIYALNFIRQHVL